jgi:hypothetical protein
MKTTLKAIGTLIAIVILLGAGYWAGMTSGMWRQMWVGSALSDSSSKSMKLWLHVNQINEGKYDELKSHLNLELDGDLLTTDALIDWDNPAERDTTAIKIIQRIAKTRATDGYKNDNALIQDKLLGIYQKAESYQHKE